MEYAVIIEKSATGYGAFVPDLPGCVAAAATKEEARALIKEAIAFHLEGLREFGEPVPPPSCEVSSVKIPRRKTRIITTASATKAARRRF